MQPICNNLAKKCLDTLTLLTYNLTCSSSTFSTTRALLLMCSICDNGVTIVISQLSSDEAVTKEATMQLQIVRRVYSTPSSRPKKPFPSPTDNRLPALCGRYFEQLRAQRGFSRHAVVQRYYEIFGSDESAMLPLSETQIKRFESGELVKLNRRFIECLAYAIGCTPSERFQLLICADMNPFADCNGEMEALDVALVGALLFLKSNPHIADLLSRLPIDPHTAQLNYEQCGLQLLISIGPLLKQEFPW
jgi:hypothetical protein